MEERKTILIADDEVLERRVLTKKLERNFGDVCDIYSAANGQEVLDLYEKVHPQVLVLDIQMPIMTGLEAAEEIRKKDTECEILFLTAFEDFSYARRAVRVRALDYLLKPCQEDELVAAVEAGLAGKTESKAKEEGAEMLSSTGALPERMATYIEANYMHDLSVQDMATHFGYADAYFCKIFKQAFGKSFITYLTDYRIRRAKEYLSMPGKTISAAGRAVGYDDPNYFAKVFKRATGSTPSEYRTSRQDAQ